MRFASLLRCKILRAAVVLPIALMTGACGTTASGPAGPPPTAAPSSPRSRPGPVGQLVLTLAPPHGGTAKQVTLTCEPTGGTHPHAQAACNDLTAADGNIAAIPPETGVLCEQILAPVVARATGTWAGARVSYGPATFGNDCLANVQTGGHVFSF